MNSLSKLFITLSAGLLLQGTIAEGAGRGKGIHRKPTAVKTYIRTVTANRAKPGHSNTARGPIMRIKEIHTKKRVHLEAQQAKSRQNYHTLPDRTSRDSFNTENIKSVAVSAALGIGSLAAYAYLYPKTGFKNATTVATGIGARLIKLFGMASSTCSLCFLTTELAKKIKSGKTRGKFNKAGTLATFVLPQLVFGGVELIKTKLSVGSLIKWGAINTLETIPLLPAYFASLMQLADNQ